MTGWGEKKPLSLSGFEPLASRICGVRQPQRDDLTTNRQGLDNYLRIWCTRPKGDQTGASLRSLPPAPCPYFVSHLFNNFVRCLALSCCTISCLNSFLTARNDHN